MKMVRTALLILLGLTGFQTMAESDNRPNFLIIVADDLGFSDLGAFGGEIETPNLDALAYDGVRLTGFHTESACAPTRAMLLTGSYSHRVGLGNMPETIQTNQTGRSGYEGFLRADAITLAERLVAEGYRTLLSGKWHLGVQPDQDPHARGFEHSFVMLHCCHNHFGIGISSDPMQISGYRENGEAITALPEDFYSTDYFADKLIEQLRVSKATPKGDAPFFAYLAFTAPHAPLQAPTETIRKYQGVYDEGYEVLRERRLRRQIELGLLDPAVVPHRMVDTELWEKLSDDEQRISAREMEIYAAMVDRIDQAVGRVLDALRQTGELDNTVIVFLSDNGAEARYVHYGPPPTIADLDRLGSAAGYVHYGPGWAQASTAPSWRFKTFATEGGIRSVAFLSGPVVAQPGSIASVYTNVMDIVPTVLELAGVPVASERFGDRRVQPIDGLSWARLLNDGAVVYPEDRPVGSELFGSRSLRRGDWKLTDIGDGKWRLFDIVNDPGETRDRSIEEPRIKAELVSAWEAYAAEVGIVLPDPPRHPNKPPSWDP